MLRPALLVDAESRPEWISGEGGTLVRWTTQKTESSMYHKVALTNPVPYVEVGDRAEDGAAYYAVPVVSHLLPRHNSM